MDVLANAFTGDVMNTETIVNRRAFVQHLRQRRRTLIPSLKPDGDGGYASTFTFGLSAGTSGSATSASTAGGASVGAALASATCTRSALGVRSVAAKLRTSEQVALDVRLRRGSRTSGNRKVLSKIVQVPARSGG